MNKAHLDGQDVRISLVLPGVAKGDEYVISAVVTQKPVGGRGQRALAHGTYLFTASDDGQPAVFSVPTDPSSRPFDPNVGIEVRASATWSCWSSLDCSDVAQWTWQLGDWG
ncbi:MAG TPA: hypothetical protein VI248_16285 [Kineosporiaceae bacterium]